MNLNNAPFEQLLRVVAIADEILEKELNRAGLRVGGECHKHLNTALPSIRIKGDMGSVIIGGGLSGKIFISVDGKIKALSEILFEDNAEIAEIKGGCWLVNSLNALGLGAGSNVRLMRRLPPMEYVIRINNKERIKVSEATAARIIGCHEDGDVQQFSSARVELDFEVTEIMGGRKFSAFLKGLGVSRGGKIVLEGLEHVSDLFSGGQNVMSEDSICLKTVRGAARIHLSEKKAEYVEVITV